MDKETQSVSFSLSKLPLSLRFIIKSFAFTAHHKHMRPPPVINDFSTQFIESCSSYIGFLVYIGSYIGLLVLLGRVTGLILTGTYNYFKREGISRVSLIHYIRYGLDG